MIEDIEQLITSAVTEVFGTMLNFKVRLDQETVPPINGESHIAGSVGFIGRLTGVVFLYSTNSFARRVTSSMLGLTDSEIEGDEMVKMPLVNCPTWSLGTSSHASPTGACRVCSQYHQ
jgi:CheY-specific phosphatase CheX